MATSPAFMCFSCCWKDVRLKRCPGIFLRCAMNVSVVVERMYDWSGLWWIQSPSCPTVSVVVERMYDWSNEERKMNKQIENRFSCCWKDVRLKQTADSFQVRGEGFQLLLKGCTIEAPKPTDWKQMIFDSWFLICFSKMVDLHKKCHYFRKFGEIWVIAWLFLIVIVTSSYILSTTKSP